MDSLTYRTIAYSTQECHLCNTTHSTSPCPCWRTFFDSHKNLKDAVNDSGIYLHTLEAKNYYEKIHEYVTHHELNEKIIQQLDGQLKIPGDNWRETSSLLDKKRELDFALLDAKNALLMADIVFFDRNYFIATTPIEINDMPVGNVQLYLPDKDIALTVQAYKKQEGLYNYAPQILAAFDTFISGEIFPDNLIIKSTLHFKGQQILKKTNPETKIYPIFLLGSAQKSTVNAKFPHITVERTNNENPEGGVFKFLQDAFLNQWGRSSTQTVRIDILEGFCDIEHEQINHQADRESNIIKLTDITMVIEPKSEKPSDLKEIMSTVKSWFGRKEKKDNNHYLSFILTFKTQDGKLWELRQANILDGSAIPWENIKKGSD